jgi:hypothetical protein
VKRRFVAAIVAVAVAFVAIVAVIWLATSPDGGPPPRPVEARVPGYEPTGVVSVDGVIDLGRSQLGGIPLPPPVIVKDEPAPPPPAGSWEAVPLVSPRGGVPGLDMEELQPLLSDCFSDSVAGRGGQVTAVKDAAPLQDGSATTLVLEIEVARDELRVVDAPLESRGQASDGTISCAQAVLRGRTAPAAGLRPGRHRFRMALQN